tara:strand:+ start:7334 stop:9919 length:2586 start_codon:yes stop_codon:yes gene_type:complete
MNRGDRLGQDYGKKVSACHCARNLFVTWTSIMKIGLSSSLLPLSICFSFMMAVLPAQAAIDATESSGATGMDTYFIEASTGTSWRATDNLGRWSNNRSDQFTETYRDANVLRLSDKNDTITEFNFQSGDISELGSSSGARKIGDMRIAHQLSPDMVNSFTYITNESDGIWRETAWDQIYLQKDEGLPSGWAREVSVSTRAPSIGSVTSTNNDNTAGVSRLSGYCSLACNFQQLDGLDIWRVDLGDIFFKLFSTGGEELLSSSSYFDEAITTSVLFREESRSSTTISLIHSSGFKVELDLKKQEIWAAKAGQSLQLGVYMAPAPYAGWQFFSLKNSSTGDAGLKSLLGNLSLSGELIDMKISSNDNTSFSFTFPDQDNRGSVVTGIADLSPSDVSNADVGTITVNGQRNKLLMPFDSTVGGRSVTGYSLGSIGWDARQSSLADGIRRREGQARLEMAYLQLNGGYEWTLVEPDSKREFNNPLAMIHKSRTRLMGTQNQAQLVINLASSRLESLNEGGTRLLSDGARVPHAQLTWMKNYYPSQFEKDVPSLKRGESPGFQVQNRTDWPVYVQLAQGSTCYNRKILQPGEAVNWDTGAVWFAIEATMNQENMPTDLECSTQALVIAGATVLGGVIAAASAGTGSGASAALMAMAVGGSFSAAGEYATSAMNAAEWSDEEKLGFSIGLFVVEGFASMGVSAASAAKEAVEAGAVTSFSVLARQAASSAGRTAMKKAAMEELGEGMVGFILDSHIEVGLNLLENSTQFEASSVSVTEASEEHRDVLLAEIDLNQYASLNDQYAGKTWPFAGEDRIRPTYVITGGPLYQRSADGLTEFIFEEIEEMKIQECDYNTREETYSCIGDSN